MHESTSRERLHMSLNRLHALLSRGKMDFSRPSSDDVDTEAFMELGDEIHELVEVEYPTLENYYEFGIQDNLVGDFPEILIQEHTAILEIAVDVANDLLDSREENIFKIILSELREGKREYAELENAVAVRVSMALDAYYAALDSGVKRHVQLLLDGLVSMTWSYDEDGQSDGFPEARLTREQEQSLRASEGRVKELGIETQNDDHLGNRADFQTLTQLGAEKGYWEGSKPTN